MKNAFCIFSMLVLASGAQAAPPAAALFEDGVKPILAKHCLSCHGVDKTRGGLDLRTLEAIRAGGDSGPILVAGKSKESLVLQLLTPQGKPHMPPRKQLAEEEIATLTKWIDSLPAEAIARTFSDKEKNHWSFRPVAAAKVPALQDDWIKNPIDAFILERLRAKGLEPNPPAERIDLVRRVYFDLIGLPPTPEEFEQALGDKSADWYEKIVDRLLASPQHGERWGRHWLDLARYADSGGFHNDIDRPHAWRYRDYVIKSLNEDKPFGQFVREQLAGDELDPGNPETLAATAFLRNGPSNEDNMGRDREKYRLDELDDVISTTGTVFLGITLGCARCHDHKFDPVTLQDYYRFLAIFNSTVKKELPLDPKVKPVKGAKVPSLMVVTEDSAKPRTTRLLWRGDLNNPGPEVGPGVPVIFSATSIDFPAPAPDARTTGRRLALADWIAAPDNPLTWRVLANRLWQHHFGRGIVASSSNFGLGGERPSHPELLDFLARELVRQEGRLKPLHRMIVLSAAYRQSSSILSPARDQREQADPDNTLLYRYPKRRLEAELIRDRILFVSGNLNPQMGGPGIKPRIHPDLLEGSQRNKWPLVKKEGPEHWRRSVYIYTKRQLQLPLLELFDAPTSTQSCSRRDVSTVPTQALALMNDDFTQDQAGYLARRILKQAGNDPTKQATLILEVALSDKPTAARIKDAVAFLEEQRRLHQSAGKNADEAGVLALTDLGHVLFNTNEFVYLD
ncbi:MAG: PSD1 and planctomycete cytochrome C domain-containing protein [Gemmataceae bacterium]